ncbi:hypothetical protein ACFOUO_04455 [Salinithrix halophila]|uniref:Uncharacterized protein n=2 Tax=Salinithrix halophila TaxID=1485204 RepID=A0ABV8JC46_9BACL
MKNGYPPVVFELKRKSEYYSALDKAHTTGDADGFLQLVLEDLNRIFYLYFRVLGLDGM